VDRLDRSDGQVWAVQTATVYRTARAVILEAPGYTQFWPGETQPRAVIVVPEGRIRLKAGIVTVYRKETSKRLTGNSEKRNLSVTQ
jgi:hypothetical protein